MVQTDRVLKVQTCGGEVRALGKRDVAEAAALGDSTEEPEQALDVDRLPLHLRTVPHSAGDVAWIHVRPFCAHTVSC